MVEIKHCRGEVGGAGHLVWSKNNEMAARRWSEALRAAKHVFQGRKVQKKYRADKTVCMFVAGFEPKTYPTGRDSTTAQQCEENP